MPRNPIPNIGFLKNQNPKLQFNYLGTQAKTWFASKLTIPNCNLNAPAPKTKHKAVQQSQSQNGNLNVRRLSQSIDFLKNHNPKLQFKCIGTQAKT